MVFTFSSLMTTLFFNSISVALLYFLLRRNEYIRLTGIRILMICILLSIIKLLIPFEFYFSKSVYLEAVWPKIYRAIMHPVITYDNHKILFVNILGCIWILGTVFSFGKLVLNYFALSRSLKKLKPVNNAGIQQLLSEILCERNKKPHLRLVSSEAVSSPYIFGIIKPYIVIPQTLINGSNKNLYFILKHEIAHYYNGDLVIRLILSIFVTIYWWNPFLYLLQDQITKMIEINIDKIITDGWTEENKVEYLNCLVVSAKDSIIASHNKGAVLFKSGSSIMTSQRIHLLLDSINSPVRPSFIGSAALLLLSLSLFLLPVFVTFEAWHISPQVAQETFAIDDEKAYYIENNDGTYDFYMDNRFVITVEEVFDSEIKIIKEGN